MAIRVDRAQLREKAEKLRVEKKKIDDVLEKFKGNTLKIDTLIHHHQLVFVELYNFHKVFF